MTGSYFRVDREVFRKHFEAYKAADPARYFETPANVRSGDVTGLEGLDNQKKAIVAMTVLPTTGSAFSSSAFLETVWRGTAALAAVRRFEAREGKLPASLAEAGVPEALRTDPYTGKELAFRADGSGFRLYSAGPDGKDDGGAAAPLARNFKIERDASGDLVFHRP